MFKVGDIVEMTAEAAATGMLDFKGGKGYKVTGVSRTEKPGSVWVCVADESGRTDWYHAAHFKLKETKEKVMEKKECLFKVGQVVWDLVDGKGVITELNDHPQYPVHVEFDSGGYYDYTCDGRRYKNDKVRSLYFSEPKIEAATEPVFEPVLKKGDVVIAISKQYPWPAKHMLTVERETEDGVVNDANSWLSKESWDFYRLGEKVEFK